MSVKAIFLIEDKSPLTLEQYLIYCLPRIVQAMFRKFQFTAQSYPNVFFYYSDGQYRIQNQILMPDPECMYCNYFASMEGKPNKQKQKGENDPYSTEDKGHNQKKVNGWMFVFFYVFQ